MIRVSGAYWQLSTVLIAQRRAATEEAELAANFFAWARPFSPDLWISIIALILLSGAIDWYLERDHMPGHKITTSLYEYCAGVLWGGFEHPLSRSSAIYQILLGFILLIINASYTANLAAFITVSSKPTLSAESIIQIQASSSKKLCTAGGAYMNRFEASYPLMYPKILDGNSAAGEALLDGVLCDGLLSTKNNFDAYRTDAAFCSFEVSRVIFVETGGWITSSESLCVFNAIEWALGVLERNGTIDRLYRNYMPEVQCAGDNIAELDTLESTNTVNSNTEESERRQRRSLDVTSSDSVSPHRKLKSGAGSGEGTAAGASVADSSTITFGSKDFIGVFTLWGLITVAVLLANGVPKIVAFCKNCSAGSARVDVKSGRTKTSPRLKMVRNATSFGLQAAVEKSEVSVDDENAMLREVLRQLGGIHAELSAVKAEQTAMGEAIKVGGLGEGTETVEFCPSRES